MLKIENTSIKGRYNLIDDTKSGEDRYIRQLSIIEVLSLGKSIIDLIPIER